VPGEAGGAALQRSDTGALRVRHAAATGGRYACSTVTDVPMHGDGFLFDAGRRGRNSRRHRR
jgi:hypothetical protein